MKKRGQIFAALCAAALLLVATPAAYGVFNEKDLPKTLSVLKFELSRQSEKMARSNGSFSQRTEQDHREMVELLKKCNELSLVLYSQNQDFTFDMTYALDEVTDLYEKFNGRQLPYDEIVENLSLEIDRYERLVESLRRLPPVLDEVPEVPDSLFRSKDSLMLDIIPLQAANGSSNDKVQRRFFSIAPTIVSEGTFYLDESGCADRDSCMAYALQILRIYSAAKDRIINDSAQYKEMSSRLKESYDYAQNRYRLIQKDIFVKGQTNYFSILKSFPRYCKVALSEVKTKYGRVEGGGSQWRGPVVVTFMLVVLFYILIASLLGYGIVKLLERKFKWFQTEDFRRRKLAFTLLCGIIIFAVTVMLANKIVNQHFLLLASSLIMLFAWLVAAPLCSILIRVPSEKVNRTMKAYLPLMCMGLIVIFFRIIFIPNTLVNIIFPPLLLGFAIWQLQICHKYKKGIPTVDMTYAWISFFMFVACAVVGIVGYVLMSIQIFIWWLFQFAALASVNALYDLLSTYDKRRIDRKKEAYSKEHIIVDPLHKGEYIQVTWLYDLIKDALLPIVAILTLPVCIYFAADVFDLTSMCTTIFYKPFINMINAQGEVFLHLSLFKIVLVASTFFIFKYIAYLLKAFYRHFRLEHYMAQNGKNFVNVNEVNLTLANNLISILVWGIYLVMAILLLKIPMGAISIVAAGLATGVGLALKDVLNNFIYGIQLMSGRLRVGDYIDCDGIRGRVESISYQSTQICTLDGSIMSVTNTALFNKNFKNLTKNNAYELVKIPVGVAYGANVSKVREVLTAALAELCTLDQYDRPVIEPKYGVQVVFEGFGDSSVDLVVKQYVLVEQEAVYIASAKELIYDTLNAEGIEIPFPQRDVHIR